MWLTYRQLLHHCCELIKAIIENGTLTLMIIIEMKYHGSLTSLHNEGSEQKHSYTKSALFY